MDEKQLGRFRSIEVSIINESTGVKIDNCPEPHLIPGLMTDLWNWLKDTEGSNPFARAFAFHLIAVAIHPFADGNGRSVRLFQHLLLLRSGEATAQYVPSETVVMRNRNQYYTAIRQCKVLRALNPMVEFMASCYAVATQEVVNEARKLFEKSRKKSSQTRKNRILGLAVKKRSIQINDVISSLNDIPRRTLERDLEELVKTRELRATGAKRGRRYSPAEKPKRSKAKKKP